MKTKRLLLAWFLACLLPLAAQAEEWTDFTFTYEYKPGSGVAKVKTCNDYRYDHGYTVEIKIPSTISIDRSNYVVTEIGERAFSECVMISQVDLPKTLTTIGSEAFAYCSKLSKIICNGQNGFPEGLTTIESGAFYYCTSLTNITIPNSITILGGEDVYYGCFDSCTNLQSVTLQDGLTEIGKKTFAGCTNLTSINIPSSVKRIGMSCFMGCTSLHDVTLQEGLDVIESSAFERCTSLVSITIPSTVTSLEGYHIYEDGSASFKAGCFEKCTSLDNVTLKEGLTTIGMDAFKDCSSLTNISIPSTVKDIEYNAFMGCTNLSEVKSFIKDPFGLYYNQFPEEAYSGTLYVPEGTKKEYASTPGWANFKNIEELETDIEGYYVISSAEKWKAFAAKAEEMPNLNARLTADINLGDDQTMIGVNVPYQGTFDGQGHTLKVNLSNSQSACAPFRNISNATIKNLHVTGTIDGGIYSAGLVASTDGTCSIENCRVSANITCTGDEYNGACGSGFVGNGMSAALAIKGCLFEGIIKNVDSGNDNRMSSRATPFIGSGNAEGTTVKDCMEKGTYVDFMLTGISFGIFEKYVINTYNSHGWYYHYRSWISYGPARSITSGQPNLVLDFGTPTTVYDVSGITAYKTGIDINSIHYASMGETIRFKAINTFGEMYESVTANGKELTPDTDGMYSLTLEDTDYIINIPTTANISTEKQLYQQGETVKISGMVGSAANAEVEVRMTGDGVSQTLTAKTDAEGAFTAEWTPYDGQMGRFAIGVRYDGKDMVDEPALIDVIGLKRTNNGYITCEAVVGEPFTGEIEVVNPCGIVQRVKAVEALSKPANCELTTEQPATIEAGSKAKVKYTLTGSAPTEGNDWELVQLRLTTEEGATIEATLYYYCHPAQAVLAANESSISTTMVKGSSRDYPVIITNRGKGGTGKIQVSMPGLQWMTLVTPAEMSSLACGEQATIMLRLTPGNDMPLNIPQTGIIGVNCENGDGLAIPFSVEVVSEQTGTLTIDVVDEFTEFTEGHPHVSGATVEVKHPITGALITQGTTDGNGKCSIELQEGYYRISVTAEKHSAYENYVLIDPGRKTTQEVFLSYQAVTASWTMVETEIEDRYDVTNTMTFETNVPKPVLVITLPDKKPVPGEVFPIGLKNEGLINTENVSMTGYCTGGFELEILNNEPIAILGPQETHTYYAVIKGDAELWSSSCVTAWVVADGYYQCRGTQHVQASAYLYYCTQTGGSPSGGTGTWSGAVPPPPFGIGGYGTVTGGATGGGTPRIQLSESVPAWVTLEIKQTMAMNRLAYQGTLTLENGHESMAVTGVGLNIIITDEEGKVATGQEFASVLENLSVFTGEAFLPGDWTLDARKTGTATVLFIPQPDAAPNGPKQYTFKGTLTFKDPFSAQQLTLPLTPFTFTVQPLPELELTYLMQRDIYGDDPLTKGVVEPMEPAEFALIINNKGNGEAKNVKIRTEQPKIVKNDQGLLIDFKIESASVNGETTNVTPQPDKSFVTDFGNIPAQSQSYAQWWLTSTLLGHFISYDVEAVHTTDYGGQNMSLISTVIIHEMVHGFTPTNNAGRGWIVNDEADEADLPDVVYFSDATKQPLHIATGKLERVSDLQYKLDISHAQSGWNYGSVNSTVGSGMKVAKVVRQSDGTELPVDNVWQTDRTLRDGRDWLYENRLHFVGDMTGDSETYLLTFAINDEQSIKDITSNGELTVRFDGERLYVFGGFNEIHGLSVYDLRGVKRVGVSNLTAGQGINVGGLKAGVYYIQVATDCGVYRAKAMKR